MKARLPQGMGNSSGNMNNVIKQAQKMQEEVEKAREELEEREYNTTVGGSAIEITANGKKEIVSLKINPEVVDPEDVEMLEDLIISGVNEVLRQVEDDSNQKLSKITGGLTIPGMF